MNYYDYEAEGMRALWKLEEDAHDCVKFSVGEAELCWNVYEAVKKKLKTTSRVEDACKKHNVSYERFQQVCKYFI